jgi:hypothetical protein
VFHSLIGIVHLSYIAMTGSDDCYTLLGIVQILYIAMTGSDDFHRSLTIPIRECKTVITKD